MKITKILSPIIAAGAIALTATPTFSKNSSQNTVIFGCRGDYNNGTLTTFVLNKDTGKDVDIIRWNSKYIDSQYFQANCKAAAKVFQDRYNNNPGNMVFGGQIINNKVAVCLVKYKQQPCNFSEPNQLFLLKVDINKNEEIVNIPKILPEIVVNSKDSFEDFTIPKFRGAGRMYTSIPPRKWWQIW